MYIAPRLLIDTENYVAVLLFSDLVIAVLHVLASLGDWGAACLLNFHRVMQVSSHSEPAKRPVELMKKLLCCSVLWINEERSLYVIYG